MPEISSSAPCGECREMCYLAMTVDDACHQPLCLACAAARPSNSGTCTILVRGTWGALERMARDFEAKQHFGAGSGMHAWSSPSLMLWTAAPESRGYVFWFFCCRLDDFVGG